jgi:hypothetical protein
MRTIATGVAGNEVLTGVEYCIALRKKLKYCARKEIEVFEAIQGEASATAAH